MSRALGGGFPGDARSGAVGPHPGCDRRPFPDEPVPPGDPIRAADRLLFSAHRHRRHAGESLYRIGRMMVADAELVLRGLAAAAVPARRPGDRRPAAQQAGDRDVT